MDLKWIYPRKKKEQAFPAVNITYADYADDLAVLADLLKDVTSLLHNIEKYSKGDRALSQCR